MIQIIDDIVSKNDQNSMENLLLKNSFFPWFYLPSSNYGTLKDKEDFSKNSLSEVDRFINFENSIDAPMFCHPLYPLSVEKTFSSFWPNFACLLKPLRVKALLRVKANITLYNPLFDNQEKHGYPHCDMSASYSNKYLTAIYYINDSTGDTFIFNEKFGEQFKKLTVKERISPKKGRAVIFDGSYYHAGNHPRNNEPRALLNLNYIV